MVEILFQDASLLVVNKPPDLPTLPGGWYPDSPSLVEMLRSDYGRVWIVHRLDKGTSGVVIFAKTSEAHRLLNMQFDRHNVEKTYHAIVEGVPKWEEHTARHPLRVNVGHSHCTVVDNHSGKPSQTKFHVLERFQACTLLEAFPATGRTHQVRAHVSALGFPLAGDTQYGASSTDLIHRPALHAFSIGFEFNGKPFSFTAPYPVDFQHALSTLRSRN